MSSVQFAAVVLGSVIGWYGSDQPNCGCRAVGREETTQYNEETIEHADPIHQRRLHGSVRDGNGDPLAGVLVEVLDAGETGAGRLAACKTGDDGRFCMQWLEDGRYQVRFSGYGLHAAYFTVRVGATGRSKADDAFVVTMSAA